VLVAPWIPVECLDQCSSFAQFWQAQQFSPFSDWKAFIKTIPRLLSISSVCAQGQASARAVWWLTTAPSVKKLAVLMTMPAASNNALVFVETPKQSIPPCERFF